MEGLFVESRRELIIMTQLPLERKRMKISELGAGGEKICENMMIEDILSGK
jgi:hypothetical protein